MRLGEEELAGLGWWAGVVGVGSAKPEGGGVWMVLRPCMGVLAAKGEQEQG